MDGIKLPEPLSCSGSDPISSICPNLSVWFQLCANQSFTNSKLAARLTPDLILKQGLKVQAEYAVSTQAWSECQHSECMSQTL